MSPQTPPLAPPSDDQHPLFALIEIMAKLGGAFGKEMPFVDGKTPGGIPTPEQARARIKELGSDTAWRSRYTSGDLAARREMEDLQKIAAAG